MTIKSRFPSDHLEVPMQFAGRFTVHDIARIGLPTFVAWAATYTVAGATAALFAAAFGLAIGLTLYLVRPGGHTVDVHLYHAAEQLLGVHASEWPEITDITDGSIVLDNGAALALLEVDGCNLSMRTTDEQAAILAGYSELFDTIDHPIEIHSRQKPFTLADHRDTVLDADPGGQAGGLKDDYLGYCRDMEADDAASTRHVIAVRVPDGDLDELDRRCRTITTAIGTPDITVTRLADDEELRRAAFQLDLGGASLGIRRYQGETVGSDDRRRVLYIDRYPEEMHPEWIADILAAPGQVDVVQCVEPIDPGEAASYLERLKERASAESMARAQAGQVGQLADLDRTEDDIDWLRNVLQTGQGTVLRYGVYVIVRGDTDEAVDATWDAVTTRLRRRLIKFSEPVLRTHSAAKTESVFHGDSLDEKLVVPSRAAATGFPFAHRNKVPPTGTVVGRDHATGLPILLDRYGWSAPHIAFMGMTGGGKSYAAKLHVIRFLLVDTDLTVHVVDPKQEYGDLTRAFPDRVNRYTVTDRTRDNTDTLVEAVRSAYRETTETGGRSIVLVDEAHRLLDDPDGRAMLGTLVREARDTETAVTLVTQNATDFTDVKEGRDILKNVPGRVFFRHLRVSDSMRSFFDLSQNEVSQLLKLEPGDADDAAGSQALVKVVGRVDAVTSIVATDAEARLIEDGEVVQPLPATVSEERELAEYDGDTGETGQPVKSGLVFAGEIATFSLLVGSVLLVPAWILGALVGILSFTQAAYAALAPFAAGVLLLAVLMSRDKYHEVRGGGFDAA